MDQNDFTVMRGKTWLNANYCGKNISFSYPPIQGTYSVCYKEIAQDLEIQPADGLDLAVLTAGAYTSQEKEWNETREMFASNYIRVPKKLLWIPRDSFVDDKALSGILVAKDWQDKILEEQIEVPQNFSDSKAWKQNDSGIYVSSDGRKQFVPSGKYNVKTHSHDSFVKDGLARAILTEEGAELFARVARDNKKEIRISEIVYDHSDHLQKKAPLLLYNQVLGFTIGCNSGDDTTNRAFGVKIFN